MAPGNTRLFLGFYVRATGGTVCFVSWGHKPLHDADGVELLPGH
jgi:hypothetical protein